MRALLIVALMCSPASAGAPCNVVQHAQNVVVKKHVVSAFATGYGAVVLQQVAPAQYYTVGAAVQEEALAERISRLVAKKLEAKGALRMHQPESPLGLSVLQAKCAKCHTPDSKPVITAGAPALFDAAGNFVATQQEIGSLVTAVRNGLMPPPPAEPLSDDDFLAIKSFVAGTK